eukprot:3188547-Pyramimonas_sp.AAC.1
MEKGRGVKGCGVDALRAHRNNDMGDSTALPSATHAAASKAMLAPLLQVGHGEVGMSARGIHTIGWQCKKRTWTSSASHK